MKSISLGTRLLFGVMEMFQHADVVGCILLLLYQMPLNCSLLKNKLSELHNKFKKKKNKVTGIGWYLLPLWLKLCSLVQ